MINNSKTKKSRAIKSIFLLSILSCMLLKPAVIHAASQLQTSGGGLNSKVAPGEFLPLSVKLLNFGSSNRVDVAIVYKIIDGKGKEIYSAQETVAVETTANFIKTVQIPEDTPPGRYTASSSIIYQGQVTPATSEFPFVVERKFFGLFQSDLYPYAGVVALVSVIAWIVSRLLIRRRRTARQGPIDYSNIAGDTRIFYELISDTVMGMRQQVGEKALDIANQIQGITIDQSTGRVLSLTQKPSKVIADLVSEYEKALGKKVSFSFRRP